MRTVNPVGYSHLERAWHPNTPLKIIAKGHLLYQPEGCLERVDELACQAHGYVLGRVKI